MTTRATLHKLVDQLPQSELQAAERFLAYLRDTADPVAYALDHAPVDDEPLTPEEEAAIEEGLTAYRRRDYVAAEEAKRELLA